MTDFVSKKNWSFRCGNILAKRKSFGCGLSRIGFEKICQLGQLGLQVCLWRGGPEPG